MSFLTIRRLLGGLKRDERGVAAIEFAMIGPLMLLVLAGGSDIGMAVFKRLQVNEAVSSATILALMNGPTVSSATVDATAKSMATILTSAVGGGSGQNSFKLTFNGSRSYDFAGSTGMSSGSTLAVDECRCPTQANGAIAWGAKVECGTVCPNKSVAGKYVSIRFTKPYAMLFPQFGFIKDGGIVVQTLALVQ